MLHPNHFLAFLTRVVFIYLYIYLITFSCIFAPSSSLTWPPQVYCMHGLPPLSDHGIGVLRAEDAYSSKLSTRNTSQGRHRTGQGATDHTLEERLVREQAMFKVCVCVCVCVFH